MLSSRKKKNSYNYCWICDWLFNVTIDWRLWLVMGKGCCSCSCCCCLLIVWSCYCCDCCYNRNCILNEWVFSFVCWFVYVWVDVCLYLVSKSSCDLIPFRYLCSVYWLLFYLSCENVFVFCCPKTSGFL